MKAASANNSEALGRLVAPDARFEIWRGDYSSSARDRGPRGVIEFAQDLSPVHYQAQSVATGPISFIPTECAWEITVLFTADDSEHDASVTFAFRDGVLVSASGNEVKLLAGNVR